MKKVASSLLTGLLAGGGLAVLVSLLAPATAAHAATVACTAPSDLYAVSGTTTLGIQPVTVWGYNTTAAAVTAPGGPTLCVNVGDTVTVTLHNALTDPLGAPVTQNTALLFQGQDMIPDRTGAAPGATKVYTFSASKPGTYLYEAGLVPNGQHQVAMGLYGALIVRPATAGQAYDDASTAFADEAVLVLSEIDPALNNAADPAAFDMRKYAPRYSLINGKAHPNTDAIPATLAGNDVLLRYVNAGNLYHSMASLGAEQRVIAFDGSPLNLSRRYVAETFGPGQTTDVIVTTPAATADQSRLAIYDGSLLLHNSNTAGSGGMLTFVTTPGTGPGVDTTGPVTSNVAYSAGTLTATIADTTGGSNITGAEYFIDTVGATGTGQTMSGSGPGSVAVTASVAVPSGEHIIYVRGQDSAVPTNWGVFSSVLVTGGDATGPTTKSPTLTPRPANGTADVAVHATADDTATGGSNITAAEYFIGAVGADGSGTPMTVNLAAPVASLDGTIPAATVNAAEGIRVVSVHSRDASDNWGAPVTVDLVVDKTGPTTSAVSVDPPHNNGTLAFNSGTQSIRVTANLSDPIGALVNSNISAAEGFIDSVGTSGTGFVVRASDGTFNSPSETGYADLPLATIVQLAVGDHTIYVHAKDEAGNWGTTAPTATTINLVIDKTKPTVSGVSATPNPTLGATSVTLSGTATDASATSDINRAEWFTGADPGAGKGTPMTVTLTSPWNLSAAIDVSSWAEGAYTLNVRARDAAGNWSLPVTTVLDVSTPVYFSTLGNATVPGVLGIADDADIYNWSGTVYSRVVDANVAPYSLPGGANVDGFDRVDATHFYLSFSGANTTVPGLGAVQDEDVVYYSAGIWSVYFDGTALGLTANNQDLDAISVIGAAADGTGGTLYFSTFGNTNPTGVGGTADDADIYSWAYGASGATPFTRVVDASGAGSLLGLPAAANVDGFVRVDATRFYLSFSTDTTVPVLGAVQDEDVVYYKNGVWSVYFNGTAHGLTTVDHDVDAFDVP